MPLAPPYGPNVPDLFRRAGDHVGVEQPTKFDLVINLNTAKTFGLATRERKRSPCLRVRRSNLANSTQVEPFHIGSRCVSVIKPKGKESHMIKIAFALAAAGAVLMTAPLLVGTVPAKAQNLKMAQGVDVQIGRDRDDRDRRRRNDSDVTIGVGPGGVTVGPRQNCRTVTTTVQRDDGRTITRKERRCD